MASTTAAAPAHAKRGGRTDHQAGASMSHRQILEALSGLMLGMFVAILSSTIVSNALPEIIAELGGGQSAYTWVVTASLLSMTATTPIWGKLADLFSKKVLVQVALVIFVVASAAAGLAQSAEWLIVCRVFQGIGTGGLSALAQIVMATMIAPRERGRYSGYLGATFAVATVGGPLLGGVITDTDWLGWRWCFYVGVPFALVALVVLQKTLHLPVAKRDNVKIDWGGAFLSTAAVCLLLLWVTFAGDKYEWNSWQTYAMTGGALVLVLLFVLVESKVSQPIIPLRLFRNRTVALSSVASLFVGVAMFAGTIFFSQYFQLARDKSPTMAGVMTIPMIGGLFVSSTLSGLIITRTGRWKGWLVSGALLLTAGLGLLGTIRYDTEYWHVAVFMAVMGVGVGMMMQNLVLCTQNQVAPADLGSASSLVTFFRSLGGAIGVSALGAVLAHRIPDYVADGLRNLGPKGAEIAQGAAGGSGEIPDMDQVPEPLRGILESAYGHGIADVFLIGACAALVAFLLVAFIKEVPLQTKGAMEQSAAEEAGAAATESEEAYVPELVAVGAEPTAQRAVPATGVLPAGVSSGGVPVHGLVRGAEGAPLPQAAITLISLGGRQLGLAIARSDGAYAVDAPGAGTYVLIASADGFQPQASTIVVGSTPLAHDVLLSGTSGLRGVVRGPDLQPVAGAMVLVTDVRGDLQASAGTADDGTFAFEELVPGPVTVAVNAAGFRPRALPVEVGAAGVTRIEVELAAGARVTGVVQAPHGPLADARVTLVDAAGNVAGTATTGADGAYAFADLDGGEYTLIATGYPPAATALSLTGAGVDGHDISLAHPAE
ncbi:MFS transporter [Krasilnikoviella flava]|uniref:Drug resistance transporter, EmrB/QacA subfamily n=1 Tax=Krasilnikoviella flava TaxID=526729 RepID=A0A1T5LZ89_9MICO|nr:MFS transporter [Krasilnikoviella flava]SKC80868.1 drug resistance transporter, EmrB/QacA subfamily [Krasilnikoviella flava]